MYSLIEPIGRVISKIFDIVYNTGGYTGVATVAGLTIGFCMFMVIMSLVKMHITTPDRQITLTWNYVSENFSRTKKKAANKTKRDIEYEQLRESRQLDKKKYIETSYRRLGKTYNYNDYKKKVSNFQMLGLLLGIVLLIPGFALGASGLIFILLGAAAMIIGFIFGETITYGSINASIKQLNYKEKIELPILISRYIAVAKNWKQYPLRDVLNTYLPYSGIFSNDIELALADIKSFGDMTALDLWQARACHHHTTDMMELTQFVEKLKKLYSSGDETYIRSELSMLQRTIDEKYVVTYLERNSNRNILFLLILMVSSFMCAGAFFILPKLMEIFDALGSSF